MKPQTFDTLTRALAAPTSRRRALGRIAGMLGLGTAGGTALAGLFPEMALAGGGNSDCAHFCNAVFAPGPDRGRCKSDGAHGTGLCHTCGSGAQSVCCPTNPDGTCVSYSSATCCSSGQSCMSGTCVAACPAGTVQLSNGSCATPCFVNNTPCEGPCGTGGCQRDASGALYCDSGNAPTNTCVSDSNCVQGYYCYATAIGGTDLCSGLC